MPGSSSMNRRSVMPRKSDMIILSGRSHPQLSSDIVSRMGEKLTECTLLYTSNRETVANISESVRGRDVYIIQTGGKQNVNNSIMEALMMAYACKSNSARSVVGVIPYLPYGKQSSMRKRGCIVSKLLAKMLQRAGFTQLITMDLHHKEVQGFFDIPIDNLRASPFLLQYIQESIKDYSTGVIVAPDPGQVKRAASYAERLRIEIAVLHGVRKTLDVGETEVDGRSSPPFVEMSSGSGFTSIDPIDLPRAASKEKPPITVVGDVKGRVAIVIDDILDEVEWIIDAAKVLKSSGATKVYVLATHGLFDLDAPKMIHDSVIDEVVVTNTVPHDLQKMQCVKIKTIDISVLLAEAIRRIHNDESMSYLFKDVTSED